MYKDYPGQVQCILLRNTSATDSGNLFPYNTEGFKDIPQNSYMFFTVPDDLTNLDIAGGQCYNATIPQNVTFKTQGLPFGWGNAAGSLSPPTTWATAVGLFVMGLAVLL
ncbi:actin patch protein 1 [Colletotrichum tofieldiae]|nr:actin patch protein 1 [Colletotrichum tofieldiae]